QSKEIPVGARKENLKRPETHLQTATVHVGLAKSLTPSAKHSIFRAPATAPFDRLGRHMGALEPVAELERLQTACCSDGGAAVQATWLNKRLRSCWGFPRRFQIWSRDRVTCAKLAEPRAASSLLLRTTPGARRQLQQ